MNMSGFSSQTGPVLDYSSPRPQGDAGLPLVKLFTDHPAAELQSMAVRLCQEIGLGVTGVPHSGNGDIA